MSSTSTPEGKHRCYVSKDALQAYLDMGYAVIPDPDPEYGAKVAAMGCILVEGSAAVHEARNTPRWVFNFRNQSVTRAQVRRVQTLDVDDEDGDAFITDPSGGRDRPEVVYKESLFDSLQALVAKHRADIIVSINELRHEAAELERWLLKGEG